MNDLAWNKQFLVANIRDRGKMEAGLTDVLTAAEEGMFTSTRKICFVLCGGRRDEGAQSHEAGPGGASRRAIAPAIGGRQVPLSAEGRGRA